MHERERHRIILSAIQEKPVVTVQDIAELTDASEATIRRDIASLHVQGKLRRVRGGAEAVHPPQLGNLAARPFRVSESVNIDKKRAIARKAVDLCNDGDAIILNGGTTTFQMVHYMAARRLQVMTNSFAIAEHLVKHSKCNVSVPGGAIYRDQSLILSPFENDAIRNFYARRIFRGAGRGCARHHGIRRAGHTERAEADAAGGRADRDGRFLEIQETVQPHSLPARERVDHHHR